ncbi:MAG: hypothetical protein AB8I08_25410 [Sandaracinaceae bacterium]
MPLSLRRHGSISLLAAASVLLLGCDPGPGTLPCSSGADCASGECMANGVCAPQQDAGSGDGGTPLRDASRPDSGPPVADAGSGLCRPDGDDAISRAEAPFGPGLEVRYRAALDVGINTAGADLGDGRRRWDFGAALPGERDLDLATEALDGRWYADRFVGADYAARLSSNNDLLGVFRVTESALELLGVVSPEEGITRTELTYAPAVRVLVFPLEEGTSWTSDTRVTGVAQGLAANYGERYESRVDARGEVVTPFAPFEALRVATTLTRDLTFSQTTVHTLTWVAPCFGSVVTATSEEDESDPEFDRAQEIRRLGF